MQYEARLKFQRDEAARMELARVEAISEGRREGLEEGRRVGIQEGRQEGLQRGELAGRVRVLQELRGVDSVPINDLANYDEARLAELARHLQQELRNRIQ